ncbi:catechol 2,3-dioxygenase-like lactoylglutathione lyase family enzyme [Sphingomonas sp. BE138]|uniref:VOC family protein n=1 Tax=Sphingomonas sp. BE138 TaxID=2817845 RepID=UPI0028659786|nr:VOC family protein [Sphingomonas sp. BE138]MDR6790292.1 catechol 2,3-dioxygenase-like lactoylglutathione lyase family enzyme [Sphingomonas sp. BE138]
MTRRFAVLACAAAALLGAKAPPGPRPAITGISHLAVYARDMAKSEHFYTHVLGARKGTDPENPAGVRYYLSRRQFVEVLPAPAGQGPSMLAHVAYATTDASALRAWLATSGVSGLGAMQRSTEGDRWFALRDPEGNEIQFVQSASADANAVPGAISGRIIHVGFAVHDRAKQDWLYRRLLGFRPYWYGAFEPDKVDWVSQQTPDGRDWLEYMMVGPGSGVPLTKVDARQLGVLNHLSLGVPNMQAAITTLHREARLSPRHDGPQMGLDGKWQANLYDPDGTRVELMEFQPVTKPCCSPFTAESPTG